MALALAGLLYQWAGERQDARRFRALGRKVDIGGCGLFFKEAGAGEPTVVLESGIASTSLSWAPVQQELSKRARVVSYDRAGLGSSDTCKAPRTAQQMVSELQSLLRSAQLPPPYVLVGHSFGNAIVRSFAAAAPAQIIGLVLVDPVTLTGWADCGPQQQKRLNLGVKLSRRGALLARFGIVRAALRVLSSGRTRLPRLVLRTSAGEGKGLIDRLINEVRKLPPEIWPIVQSHWSRPKCFLAMAKYLEALPANARSALSMPLPDGIPILVLSAENATADELRERDQWVSGGFGSRHYQIPKTGHWIQLERPDAVVHAVEEVIELARHRDRCAR